MNKIELIFKIKENEKLMSRIQKVINGNREMNGTYADVCISMVDKLISYDEIQEICKNYTNQGDFYLECMSEIINE